MASAPQPTLPLFYKDLMPLNSRDHAKWQTRSIEDAKFIANAHAIPLTVDEFVQAQRNFPIVFSSGDNPLPLALMGMNEGVNTFVNADGKIEEPIYLPAYIRRYPFMLAKLQQDSDDLSLCFDPTSEAVGEFTDGVDLFDDKAEATDNTKSILQFCEQFEQAAQRTKVFLEQLKEHDLLMDGEIAIQGQGSEQPYTYRGFQMVDQEKLKKIKPAKLKEWNENGLMMLIHAHIFSLDLMRTIFARQVQQGTAPAAFANPQAAPAN